jgi:hypothetical protein
LASEKESAARQKPLEPSTKISIINNCQRPVHHWLQYEARQGYTVSPATTQKKNNTKPY